MLLEIKNISKSFSGVKALKDVSINLDNQQIISIIGPNGAGKTTLFNVISGVYAPDSGEVIFNGENISGKKLNEISCKGIARTFQNIRLFKGLSVLDNVLTSCDALAECNLLDCLLGTPKQHRVDKNNREACLKYLELVGICDLKDERPENLSYGLQRKLELARALATKPKLLLLDEPAAGLNPSEVQDFIKLISKIHQQFNLSILIIEHRMQVVNQLSKWIHVFNFGNMLAQGTPSDIQQNEEVIKAYMGEEDNRAGN